MTGNMDAYMEYLMEEEKSASTIAQYQREILRLEEYLACRELSKEVLIVYKAQLCGRYKPSSVNAKLAAINGYLSHIGRPDLRLRRLKVQQSPYRSEERELGKEEYEKMVKASEDSGDEKMALILQTLASTGIRISELKYITVQAAVRGEAMITLKGKTRVILLPKLLARKLVSYASEKGIKRGCIFVTRSGRPLDRTWVWRAMKRTAAKAKVALSKVFPHNLRHLFARVFYGNCLDIVKLADVLGHSSVNTSRIYVISSGREHRKLVEETGLVW